MAFFFLRIANRRTHRWIIKTTVSVCLVSNLALIAVSISQCGDIATIDLDHLHCLSWTIQGPLNYFCASLNALVDWIFAALAIYIVQGLVLDTRSKFWVSCIILLATAGSIVSVVRIPYIPGLRLDTSYYSQKNDVIAFTSLIEAAVGIIAASMSVMRPLLLKFRLTSTSRRGLSPEQTLRNKTLRVEQPVRDTNVKLFQALPDLTPTMEAELWSETSTYYLSTMLEDIEEEDNTRSV